MRSFPSRTAWLYSAGGDMPTASGRILETRNLEKDKRGLGCPQTASRLQYDNLGAFDLGSRRASDFLVESDSKTRC